MQYRGVCCRQSKGGDGFILNVREKDHEISGGGTNLPSYRLTGDGCGMNNLFIYLSVIPAPPEDRVYPGFRFDTMAVKF